MIKCKNECPEGKENICCHECKHNQECDSVCNIDNKTCGDAINEMDVSKLETTLVPFETKQAKLITNIKNLYASKAKIEAQEKALKEQLKSAMEEFGIKKFEKENLVLTYIAATTATSVDSKKLKENHPDIFVECSKKSNKSAYVKVTVK